MRNGCQLSMTPLESLRYTTNIQSRVKGSELRSLWTVFPNVSCKAEAHTPSIQYSTIGPAHLFPPAQAPAKTRVFQAD
jgi:hypothetical protein